MTSLMVGSQPLTVARGALDDETRAALDQLSAGMPGPVTQPGLELPLEPLVQGPTDEEILATSQRGFVGELPPLPVSPEEQALAADAEGLAQVGAAAETAAEQLAGQGPVGAPADRLADTLVDTAVEDPRVIQEELELDIAGADQLRAQRLSGLDAGIEAAILAGDEGKAAVLANSRRQFLDRRSKIATGEAPDRVGDARQRLDDQRAVFEKTMQVANEAIATGVKPKGILEGMSPGQQVMGVLALFASGFVQGMRGGPNVVLNMLQDRVKQDIARQKDAIAGKGAQAKQALNVWDFYRRQLGDEEAADAATEATILGQAAKSIELMELQAGNQAKRIELQKGKQQVLDAQQKKIEELRLMQVNREVARVEEGEKADRLDTRQVKRFALQKTEKREERSVPGLELVGDALPAAEEATKTRKAVQQSREAFNKMRRLEDLIRNTGVEDLLIPIGAPRRELLRLSSDLKTLIVSMKGLGVPTGKDIEIAEGSFGSPESIIALANKGTLADIIGNARRDVLPSLQRKVEGKYEFTSDLLREFSEVGQ